MKTCKYEIIASFLFWCGGVFYSIFCVIETAKVFNGYDDLYGDFRQGWLISNKPKDVADFEWEIGLEILLQVYPWLIINFLVAEYLRQSYFKAVPYWQSFISITFIIATTGINGIVLIFIQPIIFECSHHFRNKFLIWICGAICLALICYLKTISVIQMKSYGIELNETQLYMLTVILCWSNLRCLGYYLDDENYSGHSFLNVLSYCIYLPVLFLGPFILFQSFKKSHTCSSRDLDVRLKKFLFSLCRVGVWYFFTEYSLHYVYVNALSYQPQIVKSLNNWSLFGYGYCMGQFFHLKYVVFYGLSTSLSELEHIDVPPLPKCIGRIHLYSDMWKYFDVGLYNFLTRYIYMPLIKHSFVRNKLFSSFLCFLFVFVWHGIKQHILIWALLNFFGIIMENIISAIFGPLQYNLKNHGFNWSHRLHCLVTSPLLALSAISNFYFFAGVDIGHIFMNRIFYNSILENATLLFFLYCCCCISMELKRWKR